MANIKKNFNFRNGVQVDDDNLLVTATGLVGIGTTVPTEALDVRGNVKIIGDATITNATVGILTLTEVVPTQIIGAGVSIKSGIVTAQGAGIVTFFGDARFLQGMPTSQWEDTNAGFGVSSIYNTGGTVGIATTNPQFTLQVGENPNQIGGVSGRGVGISSAGDINASGIVTASSFIGALTGNVTGDVTGNVVGIVTGNITGDVVGNIIGVSTGTHNGPVNLAANQDLKVGAGLTIAANTGGTQVTFFNNTKVEHILEPNVTSEIWTSEIQIPAGNFFVPQFKILRNAGVELYYANGGKKFETSTSGVNVSGTTTTGQLSVTGVSTFGGIIEGVAGQNKIPFLYSSMTDLPSAGSYHGAVAHVHATGSLYYAHAGQWWELVNKESDGRVGTGTEVYNVASINSSGIITATTELNSPLIGVGTDTPANDIQVRKGGNAEIQVTSDTGSAGLTVGREAGTSNTNNAEFRYGFISGGAPYSSAQSLDILNYGTGNFNYHLSANNPGSAVGDYHWHKGLNSGKLMTLTNTGRLGIGETQPNETLTVSGVCTISSNSFVGGNFFVAGNTTIGGDVSIDGNLIIPSINTNITGNLTGSVFGNVNIFSGISTFKKVGVNTTICFDSLDFDGINAIGAFKRLGIGQTQPDGILDVSGEDSNPVKKFILLPQVSAGSTSVIQADTPVGGGLIYNTTLRKLQFYNGTNWETVTSVEVTG